MLSSNAQNEITTEKARDFLEKSENKIEINEETKTDYGMN